jgi:hypothetical protein
MLHLGQGHWVISLYVADRKGSKIKGEGPSLLIVFV